MIYRLLRLFVVGACLTALIGCSYLRIPGRKRRESPVETQENDVSSAAGNPANPSETARAPLKDETRSPRFQEWPQKERFRIPEPSRADAAEDISDPAPRVGERDDATLDNPDMPQPPAPEKDALVRMVEAATPESRTLLEAMLQAAGDRPDKAYALLEGEPPKDKKLLVSLLRAYVHYELGDMEKAMETLDKTFREMRSQMPMQIGTAEFCRKVQSYGKYTVFSQHVFRPTGRVILYFEPQYFTCKESGENYTISLNVRYTIHNEEGKQVWQTDHTVNHQTSRYLYDLFLTQFIQMPSLPVGNYTLKIDVQDNLSEDQHKAEREVKFEIRNL